MTKFKKGKMYKLTNTIDDELYVGSTIQTLKQRMYNHNKHRKKKSHWKVYKHLNQIGWGNVSIELIEDYPCNSKKKLLKRERYWKDKLNSKLNERKPYISNKERKKEARNRSSEWRKNKDNIIKAKKVKDEWYQRNKKKVLERIKQIVKCDCGLSFRQDSIRRHKKTKKHLSRMKKLI